MVRVRERNQYHHKGIVWLRMPAMPNPALKFKVGRYSAVKCRK